MGTRERPGDRGRRRAREQIARLGSDAGTARIAAGLSLRDVSDAAGVDHARIWRFERGQVELRLGDLGAICQVVGLDLVLRAYPAGDPIRDRAHLALLERFRQCLNPSLRWSTEVPLPAPDLRAWDAVVRGSGWQIAVEAETALTDIQAVERKIALKRRDGGIDHVIVVIADTRRNRRAIAAAPTAFSHLSRRSRAIRSALRDGRDPATSAVIVL